jgi:DNA-binding CsgD family transcriptional regulator
MKINNNLKYNVSKYLISTSDNKNKKWAQIILNGIDTNYEICKSTGNVRNRNTKQVLKEFIRGKYRSVTLSVNGCKYKLFNHRILASVYIKIPNKYLKQGYNQLSLTVNHIDGNPLNLSLDNLEWCTVQENTIHAFETGLASSSIGENSHLSKIDKKTVKKICELISVGKTNQEVYDILKDKNISLKSIQHIRAGESWKNISKSYTFPKLGSSIPNSINDKTIHKICKFLEKKKYTDKEIANKCGVSREYVKDIRLHKRRKNISENYCF